WGLAEEVTPSIACPSTRPTRCSYRRGESPGGTWDHAGAWRGAAREMRGTRFRTVAQAAAALQACVPWGSGCQGLMGGRVRCTGEANYFRDYKRLGVIAKLATS